MGGNELARLLSLSLPSVDSPAATSYYLMLFLIGIFLGSMIAPGRLVEKLMRDWMVQWGLPLFLCVVYMFFDTSIGLFDLLDDGVMTKYDIAKQQRNLYLSILNAVLIIANIRVNFLLHMNHKYRAQLRWHEVRDKISSGALKSAVEKEAANSDLARVASHVIEKNSSQSAVRVYVSMGLVFASSWILPLALDGFLKQRKS